MTQWIETTQNQFYRIVNPLDVVVLCQPDMTKFQLRNGTPVGYCDNGWRDNKNPIRWYLNAIYRNA